MRSEPTTFHSEHHELRGTFYWPDEAVTAPAPLIVSCSGFTELMRVHPERFARYLTARGHACFGFDYRGFAGSEGTRGRVLLDEQVRDIVAAVSAAGEHEAVDAKRIVLLGWGLGAGLVLVAARILPGVAGLVCLNGLYDGARVQRACRGQEGFARFVEQAARERSARIRSGWPTVTDPFDIYPLDEETRVYVDEVLRATEGYYAQRYSWELADSLLGFDAESASAKLRVPLFVAHGEKNTLHPRAEAAALLKVYGGPSDVYWIRGAGHTAFMHDDDPTYQALMARIDAWLRRLPGR